MTISSTNRKAGPFTGNGIATAFPFAFKVFSDADVFVVQALTATGAETIQALATHYTVSLNPDQNANPGGTITMLVAPPAGYTLTATSQVANLQPIDVTNGGGFYPSILNAAFDRATVQIQQLSEKVGRALKTALSTPAGVSSDLPAPVANNLIGWNEAAQALKNYPAVAGTSLIDLAAPSGSTLSGHAYPQKIAYLKTLSDIANGDDVSVHRWMTQAQINDGLNELGAVDHTAAFQDAFTNYSRLTLERGKYKITAPVTMNLDEAEVDFGASKIIVDLAGGGGFAFSFGARSDTPVRTGLKVMGGRFEQLNAATIQNSNFLRVQGTQDFEIFGQTLKNVSNGGIYIEAGCDSGEIHHVKIRGASGHGIPRGIWLDGSTATDFAGLLVDTTSITRNATPAPVYAAKNININHCSLRLIGYGIYLINTRDCQIESNEVDVSGSGLRCLALNNYSPGAVVRGNRFRGDQSSHGIIVTQASNDVRIDGNTFSGSFGGGADIYVQYLADALITNNRFNTDSTQQIDVDMGGSVVVRGNGFKRTAYNANTRALRVGTLDPAIAGTGTFGNTATSLPGSIFENNKVSKRVCPVFVTAVAAANGNIAGLDSVTVKGNTFYDFDTAVAADEYGMRIYSAGMANVIKYSYFDNVVYPENYAGRNGVSVTGTGALAVRTDVQTATFRVTNAAGGGAVTVTKLQGGYFALYASRSGDSMLIQSRSVNGGVTASVAFLSGVINADGINRSYEAYTTGGGYLVSVFTVGGGQVALSTTAATFDVTISFPAT